MRVKFPENKKFAFSIFDDTDKATLENVGPVYKLLSNLGIYTTKSVFVFPQEDSDNPATRGQTLSDPKYLSFILELRDRGFEIGFHGARGISSKRADIIKAIEHFKEAIGYYPKVYANHLENKEKIYWNEKRFSLGILKLLYKILTFKRNFEEKWRSEGNDPRSEYFWGDIVKKYITYVRNLTFPQINTLKINPSMPYYDPKKPYVNFWFSSSDGHDAKTFNKLLSKENIDKLEKENGVCIVYTHFANDFVANNEVNPTTKYLLTQLSKRDGWFAPVSTILDYLASKRNLHTLSLSEKIKIETMWFFYKIQHGTS
jgi:hypothetical protein